MATTAEFQKPNEIFSFSVDNNSAVNSLYETYTFMTTSF